MRRMFWRGRTLRCGRSCRVAHRGRSSCRSFASLFTMPCRSKEPAAHAGGLGQSVADPEFHAVQRLCRAGQGAIGGGLPLGEPREPVTPARRTCADVCEGSGRGRRRPAAVHMLSESPYVRAVGGGKSHRPAPRYHHAQSDRPAGAEDRDPAFGLRIHAAVEEHLSDVRNLHDRTVPSCCHRDLDDPSGRVRASQLARFANTQTARTTAEATT